MLQSPKKTVAPAYPVLAKKRTQQRQRRLSTAYENPLLDARLQLNDMSAPPQKRSLEKQPHRRHYSVPDASMLMGNTFNLQSGLDTFIRENFEMCQGERQDFTLLNNNGDKFSMECPSSQEQTGSYNTSTNEIILGKFNAKQHMRKRSLKRARSTSSRKGSLLNDTACMAAALKGIEGSNNTILQEIYITDDPTLDTPPNTAPLISPFDMAPLPHPHFVSLSNLAMGSPDRELEDNYYSPISMISPTFPPEVHQLVFDNNMQPITEDASSPELPTAPNDPHPEQGQAPSYNHDTAPFGNGLRPMPSSVTSEDISTYIAGPEADGKWLCLYNDCGKRFGRKENIKSHVQTHLGDRQFKCQVCKKCFVRQHDLKRHAKIHTGVKPYPCLCGNSFARHDALTRHRQRGMCIGAFEGVVKKVVKRGRPRKKPLPQEGQINCSSSGSESTMPQSPQEQEQCSSASPTPSDDGESPENFPEMDSPGYTPPTSPSYDCESLIAQTSEMFNMENITGHDQSDSTSSYTTNPSSSSSSDSYSGASIRKTNNNYHNPEFDFNSTMNMNEMGLFSEDLLGLTALERDPTILSFEDVFIKPELLDSDSTYYSDPIAS